VNHGIGISVTAHVALGLVAIYGLPFLARPLPPPPAVIPIDVVEIDSITQAPRTAPQPLPEPEVVSRPPQAQSPPPSLPEPQVAEATPAPLSEPLPVPQTAPDPEPEPASPPPVTRTSESASAVQVRHRPPGESRLAFGSVLRDLTERRQAQPDDDSAEEPVQQAAAQAQPPQLPDGTRMTLSEIDAIRQQIYGCWNVPAGARGVRDMTVRVTVDVNPDGSVRQAEIKSLSRMSDPFYRSIAESARRAVHVCSPLGLPVGKYEEWKSFTLNFDPKDMIGP
jgi:outer membrane biosynthesis protein TonB